MPQIQGERPHARSGDRSLIDRTARSSGRAVGISDRGPAARCGLHDRSDWHRPSGRFTYAVMRRHATLRTRPGRPARPKWLPENEGEPNTALIEACAKRIHTCSYARTTPTTSCARIDGDACACVVVM